MSEFSARRKEARFWYVLVGAIALFALTVQLADSWLSRERCACPTVDGPVLWSDTVKRGDMVVLVRGLGVVVHEDNSSMLIARAKIPEFQALEVVAGQAAELDVRLKTGPVLG